VVTQGVLEQWHEDEGWGVIAAPATPGGCWVHYSAAQTTGMRQIARGQEVQFEWERCRQDGYEFRAVSFWIEGADGVRRDVRPGPSEAYGSVLEVRPDGPGD
jgi:CspA family cold shock protein